MSVSPPVTTLTPMMRQYLEVKAQHPGALLMYRMGDFYEMFFEDARAAAPILEVQLTARHKGTESEVPMCGVPHHALEGYLAKLLGAGLKVAICDQVEDPAQAKGLVKREVTRVVTPGTVSDPALLDGKEENLLAALVWEKSTEGGAGAFLDLSTGTFFVRRWRSSEEAVEDLALLRPREVLWYGGEGQFPASLVEWAERECPCRTPLESDRLFDPTDPKKAGELLLRQFGAGTLRGFGRTNSPASFGHPGFGGQSGWADPVTGISFGYLTNGFDRNDIREGRRRVALSSLAASCAA
jgi:DNA mismatch repair protein MutS